MYLLLINSQRLFMNPNTQTKADKEMTRRYPYFKNLTPHDRSLHRDTIEYQLIVLFIVSKELFDVLVFEIKLLASKILRFRKKTPIIKGGGA